MHETLSAPARRHFVTVTTRLIATEAAHDRLAGERLALNAVAQRHALLEFTIRSTGRFCAAIGGRNSVMNTADEFAERQEFVTLVATFRGRRFGVMLTVSRGKALRPILLICCFGKIQ